MRVRVAVRYYTNGRKDVILKNENRTITTIRLDKNATMNEIQYWVQKWRIA